MHSCIEGCLVTAHQYLANKHLGFLREGAHQWLVKKGVVQIIPFIFFRGLDQLEQAEVVEVPVLLRICHRKVADRSAGFVDDLIHKLVRVFKWQLANLLQDAFAEGRLLLHEVDVVVHPPHHKLIADLQLQACEFTHSLTRSLTHLHTHSLTTHLLTHSPTHSPLTHSLTHSLTRSLLSPSLAHPPIYSTSNWQAIRHNN